MGLSLQEIERRINLHIDRQQLLASNIANSETPNYKAKDINFDKALNKEVSQLAATNEKHIQKPLNSGEIVTKEGGEWKDGNNVELNEEIGKMSVNKILHDFYVARFSGYVKKYKMAISNR